MKTDTVTDTVTEGATDTMTENRNSSPIIKYLLSITYYP